MFSFPHHYHSPQRNPIYATTGTRRMMSSVYRRRHRCSHSPILDTGTVTVTLPSRLLGSILIVVLAIIDHWHRSFLISPYSRLVVMLSASASVSASCHVPFVRLIVMFSADVSSFASHHAPCLQTPSPCHRPWHYGGKHSLLNLTIR